MDAASNNPEKAKRLTELFIKFTSERLGDLEDAIGRGDATDVSSIAHKSLGSSRTLGMNAIVPALRELEVRGRAGELHGLGEHLETAKSEFAKIKTILKEHFDAGPTAPSEVNSYV
jgi:HPt (histidine-containing phosphotransfer) domain-containing protein